MNDLCPLYDLPIEIGDSSSWRKVSSSPLYFASLNKDNVLNIFSIENRRIELTLPNVLDFCWIHTSILKSHALGIILAEKMVLFTSDKSLPEVLNSDPSTRLSPLIMKDNSGIFSSFCELPIKQETSFICSMEANCFAIRSNKEIKRLTIFSDGIYSTSSCSNEGCNIFSYSGESIAGLSSTHLHIWNRSLTSHALLEIFGSYICTISQTTFAVLHGNVAVIVNESADIVKQVNMNENTIYLSQLMNDSYIYVPHDYLIVDNDYRCPIILKDYTVFAFDNSKFLFYYIEKLPMSFSIQMLSAIGRQSANQSTIIAEIAVKYESVELIEAFSSDIDEDISLSFVVHFVSEIEKQQKYNFAKSVNKSIIRLCTRHISNSNSLSSHFLAPLTTFKSIVQSSRPSPQFSNETSLPNISQRELLSFVIDNLHRNTISSALPVLQNSFPEFSPFHLFRTIVLQQAWVYICNGQIGDSNRLIDELKENPDQHFYEMWRQTTRNRVRATLYEYLHRKGVLSAADEEHHQVLLKITSKYPNTSFSSAKKNNNSPAIKIITDVSKLPSWQPIVDLSSDFHEKRLMIFPELFQIPDEPVVESPRYFVGNIALIEAQTKQTLKMLVTDGITVERLWVLHCEHRVTEIASMFKKELEIAKKDSKKKLKSIKFMNKYHSHMNTYELETLLDVLCQAGYFSQFEIDSFELLLIRICKNKFLFDQQWWSKCSLNFTNFFKGFARFCNEKNLFMPFEMFVASHPKCKEIDLSDIECPMIKFIWDLWIKRDPGSANLSCMQYLAKSNSSNPVELWQSLPSDSLAPLATFVWNKDPNKFKPDSPETEALSQRLKTDYPLLSSLVKGEIPHPPSPQLQPPVSKWRSPVFTSKFDLELHDLIASHFDYDFSKVFTDYYGKFPGQPPFPHFDHPELVSSPSEPPYIHYVKAMLPVSAYQQAVEDGITESKYKELCLQCMKEALVDENIRLAALTFIELVDIKFQLDIATDYKLSLSIYDSLKSDGPASIIEEISKIFVNKCKVSAQSILKKINPSHMESFLLAALLSVRCQLPIDYNPIKFFCIKSRPAELLLYIDRATELGSQFSMSDVVKIIREDMPDHPLKDHLLFHLTQSLPAEDGSTSIDIPPALVVFRALRRTDMPQHIALLFEAINRKNILYALLATSIDGHDNMTCALAALLTMSDSFSLDICNLPQHESIVDLFFQLVSDLLIKGKSKHVLDTIHLFSETSLIYNIVRFYNSVENFTFYQSDCSLEKVNSVLSGREDGFIIEDDLLSKIPISGVYNIMYCLYDHLAKICAKKSQVHLFRYLQGFYGKISSPVLSPLIKMASVVEKFNNFRKAIMQCDLLGPYDKIVQNLTLNHSLKMGQDVAAVLGTSSSSAIQQWLKNQYINAKTPIEVLHIHSEISSTTQDCNDLFNIVLFASLLPYSQPSEVVEILKYAQQKLSKDLPLFKQVEALILHIQICSENSIEVPSTNGPLPTTQSIIDILFPQFSFDVSPHIVYLRLESRPLYSIESMQKYFDIFIDRSIDICLDSRRVDEARLLCQWRNRNQKNILLLESIQKCVAGEQLSKESEELLSVYGFLNDLEPLLDAIAAKNEWRFVLISLHYKAAVRLGWPTKDLLKLKTSEFVESELSVRMNQWSLIQELITVGKLNENEVADCLSRAFSNHVVKILSNPSLNDPTYLPIDDYSTKFNEFSTLSTKANLVGDALLNRAKELMNSHSYNIVANILLHSSIQASDIDECAELLDLMLDTLTTEKQLSLIIEIVTTFKDPALLPRYFQYLIAQQKLDALPHDHQNKKVGRVIMNCARHSKPFEPQRYFDLTLNYMLYRDHGELQMEYGNRLLEGIPDKKKIQEASKHFLLALAYFLHEKCYSLSMECLKKLSLLSLPLELSDFSVLNLESSKVLDLMKTQEFPFALTIAVAYDMDTEENWAESIFTQSILNKKEDFLTAFQYFRPITSNICEYIVARFKSSPREEDQQKRMKQFLNFIPNLVEKYRIAKSLGFQDQIDSMKDKNPVVCEWCERVMLEQK